VKEEGKKIKERALLDFYERNKKGKKDNSSSNVKSLNISVNTVEKDKDYAFMIEEVLNDEDNISQFKPEETLNRSWFESL